MERSSSPFDREANRVGRVFSFHVINIRDGAPHLVSRHNDICVRVKRLAFLAIIAGDEKRVNRFTPESEQQSLK